MQHTSKTHWKSRSIDCLIVQCNPQKYNIKFINNFFTCTIYYPCFQHYWMIDMIIIKKKSIINTCSTVIEKRNTPHNYREFTLIYIKYQKEISYIECNYKTCTSAWHMTFKRTLTHIWYSLSTRIERKKLTSKNALFSPLQPCHWTTASLYTLTQWYV